MTDRAKHPVNLVLHIYRFVPNMDTALKDVEVIEIDNEHIRRRLLANKPGEYHCEVDGAHIPVEIEEKPIG